MAAKRPDIPLVPLRAMRHRSQCEIPGCRHHRWKTFWLMPDGLATDRFADMPIGAAWWASLDNHDPCSFWSNCLGPHLIVKVPGPVVDGVDQGHLFDAMWKASNCTRKDENTHRCWVVEGYRPLVGCDLKTVTVSKGFDKAQTCSAGAGSIATPEWHGFIRNGKLVTA
jgi:hypothetical protein